jgi:hypothetical protein
MKKPLCYPLRHLGYHDTPATKPSLCTRVYQKPSLPFFICKTPNFPRLGLSFLPNTTGTQADRRTIKPGLIRTKPGKNTTGCELESVLNLFSNYFKHDLTACYL